MQISRLLIKNFRAIHNANIILPKHSVLIGDNNTGKTTILEAIDLALGPDRLNRVPPVNEHDFYHGKYITASSINEAVVSNGAEQGTETEDTIDSVTIDADVQDNNGTIVESPQIDIEVTITDLSEEQKGRFGDYIEFWDTSANTFYDQPNPAGVDVDTISEALRISFIGCYNEEDDDFEGRTYFTRSLSENDNPVVFSKKDKQFCGYLYLRSLRTGTRALSMERGSLLDIILRLKEVRPKMWEDTINQLSSYSVASDPELGISGVLESIDEALQKYVPKEWGIKPHLKVSNLTREHLRKIITAFIATGEGSHSAPFYMQGTGTINMLVLAMLSQIAEDKQNVIFAMEEPETAIPPYAQKRIVHEIRTLASQAIFTSHSPYVLEEFTLEETVVLTRDIDDTLCRTEITLPDSVKLKRYRQEFRTRFCEGLLTRRIMIAEGATEAASFPVACRRLSELKPDTYSSLEALGICTIDAGGETNIPDLAKLYRDLGKRTFAICDKQTDGQKALIEARVEALFMYDEKGFEDLIIKNTTENALKRFVKMIDWPQHLKQKYPDPEAQVQASLSDYLCGKKADWGVADFLSQCSEDEIPKWLRDACISLKEICEPVTIGNDTGDEIDASKVPDGESETEANAAH
jgi:putative ATP-dependent endonuclease of OLD family